MWLMSAGMVSAAAGIESGSAITSTQLMTSQPGICDGEPAGEGVADRGDGDRREQQQIAGRERAAALAQRKRDHQRGAGDRGDPEQRPRPLMGDGDGDQRGGDRQHAQHHAAMRGVDASASASAIRNGNRTATQSMAITSCGHSARGGSGRRNTISSASEHSPAIAVRSEVSAIGSIRATAIRVAGSVPPKIAMPMKPSSRPRRSREAKEKS